MAGVVVLHNVVCESILKGHLHRLVGKARRPIDKDGLHRETAAGQAEGKIQARERGGPWLRAARRRRLQKIGLGYETERGQGSGSGLVAIRHQIVGARRLLAGEGLSKAVLIGTRAASALTFFITANLESAAGVIIAAHAVAGIAALTWTRAVACRAAGDRSAFIVGADVEADRVGWLMA